LQHLNVNNFAKKFIDKYDRHRQRVPLEEGYDPKVFHPSAFVAPSATLVGNVEVHEGASVWYHCVVKADVFLVRIGPHANVQDGTVISEAFGPLSPDHDGSTIIGHYVTVGHGCILRACTIEEHCLVGMGCILEEGSYMEVNSILAAGSVLRRNQRIPSGQLWAGNPAKFFRDVTIDDLPYLAKTADKYIALAGIHNEEFFLPNHCYLDAEKQGIKVGWQED